MEYLFVYGTLLQSLSNPMSKFLSRYSKILGTAYFHGKLYDVGAYPAAISSNSKTDKVYGIIVEILNTEHTFKVLDAYEGVKENLYIRKPVTAFLNNHSNIKTWIYLYSQPTENLNLIPSGDYLKR